MLVRNLIGQLAVHYFTSLCSGCYSLGPLSNQSDPKICCTYLCDVNCEAGSLYYYYYNTVESRDYAPPLCMLGLGKSGEGAYIRDPYISV